ncbi:MAG: sigma 54-interacting transcriptional regulator [Candidatus Tectomicrobia bacterium]|nr:sigma 54-interacting transcriptional regulator [Candidatus Tectomicrobia bacterium]
MNLHGTTTTEFVREWQAGESPLYSSMANQSRWDGTDPALGQEQPTFEAMFNALPAATVFTDLHGEIRLVNRAFTTLFGSPPQDVIGKPIDLFYVCMADEQAAGRFQPHGHTGDIATPVDVRYRTNDGGTFIGETVVTAVKNGEGPVLGWLRLIREITGRKHADTRVEADLARLAKKHRYESIVSAVAHSVHQSTTLQAVLENAVEAMRTHIERIDAIEIFLREGEEAALRAHAGLPDWVVGQIRRLPAPQGYTWKVISDGQPRYCADVDQDAFIHPAGRAFGVKSYVSMPISAEGKTVGAININSLQKHAFDDDELRLLEILSAHLETAIHNAQQAEALRQALAEVERLKNRLQAENVYLQEEITTTHRCGEIIGQSRALQEVLRRVEQVAPTDATVLIQGETGTGKELIARAIHRRSRYQDRPLVKVNCATLPAGLVESELFGHEKGAFTGAIARKIGRFELADGGTIFLDEVGELPLELQAKLLRILQEGEFERVGGSHTITVNVRVIAATNRDLATAVQAGSFRADLFYRLNVFPLTLPPLRERQDDIPLLVECFLAAMAQKLGKPLRGLSAGSMARMLRYAWPGNVREVQNVVERAAILARGPIVEIDEALEQRLPPSDLSLPAKSLQDMERVHILRVLGETHGVIEGPRGAARILGLHPNTLRFRLQKLGITHPRRRP